MEAIVGRVDELAEGEMREVTVGETPVLLVRLDGSVHALGARCTHYGAPLADGMLCDGRIICPWHHACFDGASGDLLEPPALDSLPSFPLRVDGDHLLVAIPDDPPDRRSSVAEGMVRPSHEPVIAIVGGGAAGYMAAQALRECGEPGRVTMITPESRLPYDRPNLSKDYLDGHADPAWMPLRSEDFFIENRIEVMRGIRATRLDAASHTIELSDGSALVYDTALVATGCVPRRLDVPGADLERIHLLRSFDDADAIVAGIATGSPAVVIGASFIAMEAAAALVTRGMSVTVVAPDDTPFARTLGPQIGRLFREEHEKHGVTFRLGASVARFEGSGRVEAVVLESGERIAASLVVVGIGVVPATDFIEGVERDERGGVIVDARMRAADGLYAAGDIATFPEPRTGEPIRIEHWRTALQLGRVAGANIAGVERTFDDVPFFWTRQFDLSLHYVGHAAGWDEIVVRGDIAKRELLAYYVRDGRVAAAASIGRDRELIAVSEALRTKGRPTVDELPD